MPLHESTINAAGQTLGRVATRAASLLRGKHLPDFDPSKMPNTRVTVEHASELRFTGSKLDQKFYYRFSGYPGGLKRAKLRDVFEKSPDRVVRTAVRSMLPATKHRSRLLKRLIVTP